MRILAVALLVYGAVILVSWMYREHHGFSVEAHGAVASEPLPWRFDTERTDVESVELIDADGRVQAVLRGDDGAFSGSIMRGRYQLRLLDAGGNVLERTTLEMLAPQPADDVDSPVETPTVIDAP